MNRERTRGLAIALGAAVTVVGAWAHAQGGVAPTATTQAPADVSGSGSGSGPVDPSDPHHGMVPGAGADDAPDEAEAAPNPHGSGHAGHGAADGMFQPPEDVSTDDPTLPTGSIELTVADPTGKPIPGASVTLGILYNSVAKGDSRKRVVVAANDKGVARFEHLDVGSSVAYRPMVIQDDATFSMMPFRLSEKSGMKALLHVYPVVEDLATALVVSQSVIYSEVKDDRIQVQQAFKFYNFGKSAWVPKDFVVPLPPAFTAFTTQQGMTDIGADAIPNKGVRIHGTFTPGQHMLEFRWQLPYSGESEVSFDVGMPPHMAASRVIAPASKDMKLEVPGFPPPQSTSDGQGQRALITEKQMSREDAPVKSVTVAIRGLPSEGPAKIIATLLSAAGVVLGLVYGSRKPKRRDAKPERARLLDELEDLERARRSGDVGPKTYEAARSRLVDALARTFADADADAPREADTKRLRARTA